MFFDLIPLIVRNFLDSIFSAPMSFLQMGVDYLANVSLIAGKGINLNHYLGFYNYLPDSIQNVLNSLISSIIFLAVIQLVVAITRMYYATKAAVKWW